MQPTNKKCEQEMKRFLELDKGQHLPLSITIHILKCKKCRSEIRHLTIAEKEASMSLTKAADDTAENNAQLEAIMSKVNPFWDVQKQKSPVSLTGWIASGVAMILLMIAFGLYSKTVQSQFLNIAFYLVFSGVVMSYVGLFIAENMDFFIKLIGKKSGQ